MIEKGRGRKVSCEDTLRKTQMKRNSPTKLKTVSAAPGEPLLRQLTVAMLIEEMKPLMKTKDEWVTEVSNVRESLGNVISRH